MGRSYRSVLSTGDLTPALPRGQSRGTLMKEKHGPHSLLEALRARYGEPDREVVEGVRTLSRLFTKERDSLGGDYFADPALCRAYCLYFLPLNVAKVASLLGEMPVLSSR